MTIAPIHRTISVAVPPERAFVLFTERMHDWWPTEHTIASEPRAAIVMEPHVDGRWLELGQGGAETQWGKVLAWEPPERVLLAWQINALWKYDPELVTELEITFTAKGGNTLVTLEHRHLERFGESAAVIAEQLRNGWPGVIGRYGDFANGVE